MVRPAHRPYRRQDKRRAVHLCAATDSAGNLSGSEAVELSLRVKSPANIRGFPCGNYGFLSDRVYRARKRPAHVAQSRRQAKFRLLLLIYLFNNCGISLAVDWGTCAGLIGDLIELISGAVLRGFIFARGFPAIAE